MTDYISKDKPSKASNNADIIIYAVDQTIQYYQLPKITLICQHAFHRALNKLGQLYSVPVYYSSTLVKYIMLSVRTVKLLNDTQLIMLHVVHEPPFLCVLVNYFNQTIRLIFSSGTWRFRARRAAIRRKSSAAYTPCNLIADDQCHRWPSSKNCS